MKKRIAVSVSTLAIAGFAVAAVPATASAEGYGKSIKDGCGASYGQLVSTARAAGHVTGSVGGAMNFVESGLAKAHGCS